MNRPNTLGDKLHEAMRVRGRVLLIMGDAMILRLYGIPLKETPRRGVSTPRRGASYSLSDH